MTRSWIGHSSMCPFPLDWFIPHQCEVSRAVCLSCEGTQRYSPFYCSTQYHGRCALFVSGWENSIVSLDRTRLERELST